MKIKLLLLPLFACTLTLTACTNVSDDNTPAKTADTIYKENKDVYTATDLVLDTRNTFGGDTLVKSLLYKIISDKYPADEKQVELTYNSMVDSYGSEKELLKTLAASGLTKEQYKNTFRYELSYSKALAAVSKPQKKELKELYAKNKDIFIVTQVRIDKNLSKKTHTTVKDMEESLKKGNLNLDEFSQKKEVTITKDKVIDNLTSLAAKDSIKKLAKGEYTKVQDSPNVTVFYIVQDVKTLKYKDIEPQLISFYNHEKGLDTPKGLLNYFIEQEGLETQKLYKDILKQ